MVTESGVRKAAEATGLEPLSFVLWPLDNPGERVEVDARLPLYPASMIKTPLAAAVYALAADGVLSLDERLAVQSGNLTANDAESPLVEGYLAPVRELLQRAIARSDNVATNMLMDLAGRERATAIVQKRFGLRDTAFHRKLSGSLPLIDDAEWDGVHRNTHPAADAAKLFEAIWRREIPFAAEQYAALCAQEWNDKIPPGLLPDDRFAHKTGDTDEVTHDGGILESEQGRAYVLVVYTGLPSSPENNGRFAAFMRRMRTHIC